MARFTLIFLIQILSLEAFASSCCGSGQAFSFLILSEQRLMFKTSSVYRSGLGRVHDSKDFHVFDGNKKRQNLSLNIETAFAFDLVNQIGLSGSLLRSFYSDEFGSQNDTNLGDIYFSYSRKIEMTKLLSSFLSLGLIIPSGNSIFDEGLLSENTNVNSFGRYGLSLSATFYQNKYPFSYLLNLRYARFLEKNESQQSFDQFMASFNLGRTVFGLFDLSGGLDFLFNSSSRSNRNKVDLSKITGINLSLSKSIGENSTVSIIYQDQTFIGGDKNSLLERGITLNYIFNYF